MVTAVRALLRFLRVAGRVPVSLADERLPLPVDVTEALADYVTAGRP